MTWLIAPQEEMGSNGSLIIWSRLLLTLHHLPQILPTLIVASFALPSLKSKQVTKTGKLKLASLSWLFVLEGCR